MKGVQKHVPSGTCFLPFNVSDEFIYCIVEFLKLGSVRRRAGNAMLDMILEDYLRRVIERRAHCGKLYEHLGAVASILDHALDGFQMTYRTGKPVDDRLCLRVGMPMSVAVHMHRAVCMNMCVYFFLGYMHACPSQCFI